MPANDTCHIGTCQEPIQEPIANRNRERLSVASLKGTPGTAKAERYLTPTAAGCQCVHPGGKPSSRVFWALKPKSDAPR